MEMDKFGSYGPSVENYQSPAQTPLYADTQQSFFSKNDPTHSLSYVSDKDGDGSNSTDENREDHSTGSVTKPYVIFSQTQIAHPICL